VDDGERRGGAGSISDMMKKAIAAGIGAVFMTEESLRSYLSEARLPREIAKALLQQSAQAKEQVMQFLSREIAGLIRKTDVNRLLLRVLEGHEIEVKARIRFRRVSDGRGGLVVRALSDGPDEAAHPEDAGPGLDEPPPPVDATDPDPGAPHREAAPNPTGASESPFENRPTFEG